MISEQQFPEVLAADLSPKMSALWKQMRRGYYDCSFVYIYKFVHLIVSCEHYIIIISPLCLLHSVRLQAEPKHVVFYGETVLWDAPV